MWSGGPRPPPVTGDPFPLSSYVYRACGGLSPDLSCKQSRDLPILRWAELSRSLTLTPTRASPRSLSPLLRHRRWRACGRAPQLPSREPWRLLEASSGGILARLPPGYFSLWASGGGRSDDFPIIFSPWFTTVSQEFRNSVFFIVRPSCTKASGRCSILAEHSSLLYGVVKVLPLNILCTTFACRVSHMRAHAVRSARGGKCRLCHIGCESAPSRVRNEGSISSSLKFTRASFQKVGSAGLPRMLLVSALVGIVDCG